LSLAPLPSRISLPASFLTSSLSHNNIRAVYYKKPASRVQEPTLSSPGGGRTYIMNNADEDTKVWLGNDCASLTTVRKKTAPTGARCIPWSEALKTLSPTELPPWMQIPPEVKTKKKESVQSGWKAQYESALKYDDMSSGAGREAAKAALLALGVSLPRGEKYNNLEEGLVMEQLMRLPHRSPQRGAAIKLMCRGGIFFRQRSDYLQTPQKGYKIEE